MNSEKNKILVILNLKNRWAKLDNPNYNPKLGVK